MYGLKFNGKHSSEFGLVMYSKNRPITPEPKIITDEAPGMDGDYDYSEVNPDGRTKFKPRIHEIQFEFDRRKLNCRDPRLVRIRAHEIAMWLKSGEQQLIYDDETAVFYLARVNNKLDLEAQIQPNRPFTVQFKCRPYGYLVTKSNEQMQFGQGLMLGYGLRLDMVPTVFTITGPASINLYNPGDFVKPLIHVTGTYHYFEITVNGKTLSYGHIDHAVDIDCFKAVALEAGVNANKYILDGSEFIELAPGNNSVVISGEDLNLTISFEFRALYL